MRISPVSSFRMNSSRSVNFKSSEYKGFNKTETDTFEHSEPHEPNEKESKLLKKAAIAAALAASIVLGAPASSASDKNTGLFKMRAAEADYVQDTIDDAEQLLEILRIILDDGRNELDIMTSERINIDYAEECRNFKWRYYTKITPLPGD